jgi:polyisoprenoid-binding protein YceI
MSEWKFDPAHTSVTFAVRHMMVTTVRGQFQQVSGSLHFDPKNMAASSVEAAIVVNSLTTGAADRDNHLRSADFLEVANYPEITFKSTRVELTNDSTGKVTGNLTIHGKTLPVKLDVEYLGQIDSPFGDTRVGFTATVKINREDFGLTWNRALEAGGVLVGKDITINLDVEAARVAEPARV